MFEHAQDSSKDYNVIGHEQPQSTTLMALSEDSFMYKFDSCGFRPEEVRVEERGDELIIEGRHSGKSAEGDSKSERTFEKRVRVPEGIIAESIRCELDDDGRLMITGKKRLGTGGADLPQRQHMSLETGDYDESPI
ncbi:major egg antigen [Aphelenchoides avenae]|nr:major egg antigen [Aphelenchus avenae]